MPIDQSKERPEPLAELSKIIHRRFGVDRKWKTLWRWTRGGVADKSKPPKLVVVTIKTKNGTKTHETNQYPRLRMESLVIGGVVHSSVEAYQRFVAKLSEGRA